MFPGRGGRRGHLDPQPPTHLPPGCQLRICSVVPCPQHPRGFGVSVVGREVGGEKSPASEAPLATETLQTEPSKFLPPRRVRSQHTGPRHSPVPGSAPGARLCLPRGLSLTSAGRTLKVRGPAPDPRQSRGESVALSTSGGHSPLCGLRWKSQRGRGSRSPPGRAGGPWEALGHVPVSSPALPCSSPG